MAELVAQSKPKVRVCTDTLMRDRHLRFGRFGLTPHTCLQSKAKNNKAMLFVECMFALSRGEEGRRQELAQLIRKGGGTLLHCGADKSPGSQVLPAPHRAKQHTNHPMGVSYDHDWLERRGVFVAWSQSRGLIIFTVVVLSVVCVCPSDQANKRHFTLCAHGITSNTFSLPESARCVQRSYVTKQVCGCRQVTTLFGQRKLWISHQMWMTCQRN